MTYSTTHLGIGVILVYYLLPKTLRAYLKNNPKIFFLTSLGTIIPDLDLLTSGHRAYGHSILFPLLLLVIAPLIEKGVRESNVSRNIRLFSLFWIAHLIYDTTFGPFALFFPVDPRFYDIRLGLTFDLTTQILAPVGFFVSVTLIDQRTGVDTFFVNWTPEQRVATFGAERINWPISDFFLHATIFLWYCGFVILPLIQQIRNDSEDQDPNPEPFDFTWRYKKWVNPLLLLFLTLALSISGPLHGTTWTDTQQFSGRLQVSNDNLNLLGSQTINVPEKANFSAKITSNPDRVNYSIFVVIADRDLIDDVQQQVRNLIAEYNNHSITFSNLISGYQSYIQSEISSSIQEVTAKNSATWELQEDETFSLLFGLYKWNKTLSFSSSLLFDLKWNISLERSFVLGTLLTLISGISTIVVFVRTYRKQT